MILSREFDMNTGYEYEVWSEMNGIRLYDIDFTVIIDEALDYMALNSLWCFKVMSSNGTSEEDVIETLNRNGTLYFYDSWQEEWFWLTREKLVIGLSKVIKERLKLKHEILRFGKGLSAVTFGSELCDEIVQVSLFGCRLYK